MQAAATRRHLGALLLACTAWLVSCASAPPAVEPVALGDDGAVQRQVRALVAHELRAAGLASLAVTVVDARGEVFAQAQGVADAATGRAATPDTLYRMGSVSKLFTDTAALALVQQGRLSLDAPLPEALPGLRLAQPWPERPPTLRQLMAHQAGLPRDLLGGMWVDPAAGPVPDFRRLPAQLAQEVLALPPGTAWSYSNIGLTLLGLAVERAAGEAFEAHLQRALLAPLGMADASFSAAPSGHPRMARGHLGGQPRTEPALRDVPAGGLNASVRDVGRFVTMMLAGGRSADGSRLLDADLVAAMQQARPSLPLDLAWRTGLGWLIDVPGEADGRDSVRGAGPVLEHGGATFHFRSQVLVLPAQGLGVVVASNDARAQAAVRRVAAQALALQLQARRGMVQPAVQAGVVVQDRPFSAAERTACAGDWLTPFGVVRLHTADDKPWADLMGQRLNLLPGQDGRFGLRLQLMGWLPVDLLMLQGLGFACRAVAGRQLLIAWRDGRPLRLGERLPPAAPLPADLVALQGRYAIETLTGEWPTLSDVTVQVRDGRLTVIARLPEAFGAQTSPPLPVLVVSGTEGRLLGPFTDGGQRLQVLRGDDGSPVILASGWRLRRTGGL